MTVKQFFKSTAFKCVATLMGILLVCGVFLTVMYGFLQVSDEERFDRAIQKIYGKSVETTQIDISEKETSFEYSDILELYKVEDDGNYLVLASGKEGFGGVVECWVVVKMENGAVAGVNKISVNKANGESYISKVSQGALDSLAQKADPDEELMGGYKHGTKEPGGDYVQTGASYSMRAISNAVNGAMEFVKSYVAGGND